MRSINRHISIFLIACITVLALIPALGAAQSFSGTTKNPAPRAAQSTGSFSTATPTIPPEDWGALIASWQKDATGAPALLGLVKANEQRQQMIRDKEMRREYALRTGKFLSVPGIRATKWQPIGPNLGGRVRAMAFGPRPVTDNSGRIVSYDAKLKRLWIGASAGGIWYSDSYDQAPKNVDWKSADRFLGNLTVTSLVIDPVNPLQMYAATGEGGHWPPGTAPVSGMGILRSSDGGLTWEPSGSANVRLDARWANVHRLALRPDAPSQLLAAVDGGVFRSSDAGSTWNFIPINLPGKAEPFNPRDIRFDPRNGNVAIAGGGGSWIAFSGDAGLTWKCHDLGGTENGRVELAFSASEPGAVYASHAGTGLGAISRISYATGAGGFAVDIATLATPGQFAGTTPLRGTAWSNALWADPTKAGALLLGARGLLRSDGSLNNWISLADGTPEANLADRNRLPPNIHAILADTSYNGQGNRRIFLASDGGLHRIDSLPQTTGDTLNSVTLNHNLFIGHVVNAGAVRGKNALAILASTESTYTLALDTGAKDWRDGWRVAFPAPVAAIEQNPSGGALLTDLFGNLHRSTLANPLADSYQPINLANLAKPRARIPAMRDPRNPASLYEGPQGLILRDETTGSSKVLKTAVSGSPVSAIGLGVSHYMLRRSDILWVGLESATYPSHEVGTLYRTPLAKDRYDCPQLMSYTTTDPTGTAWVDLGSYAQNQGLPRGRTVSRILTDPNNSASILVAYADFGPDNLWGSTDFGCTWKNLSGEITAPNAAPPGGVFSAISPDPALPAYRAALPEGTIYDLARNPSNPLQLHAATESGLYFSDNGGRHWFPDDEPGNVAVEELFWVYRERGDLLLLAGTRGGGMFAAEQNIQAFAATSAPLSAAGPAMPSGNQCGFNLEISVLPDASESLEINRTYYLAVQLADGSLYFYNGKSLWISWSGNANGIPPSAGGASPRQRWTIRLANLDLSGAKGALEGAKLYVGYGFESGGGSAFDEMLKNSRYTVSPVYTIKYDKIPSCDYRQVDGTKDLLGKIRSDVRDPFNSDHKNPANPNPMITLAQGLPPKPAVDISMYSPWLVKSKDEELMYYCKNTPTMLKRRNLRHDADSDEWDGGNVSQDRVFLTKRAVNPDNNGDFTKSAVQEGEYRLTNAGTYDFRGKGGHSYNDIIIEGNDDVSAADKLSCSMGVYYDESDSLWNMYYVVGPADELSMDQLRLYHVRSAAPTFNEFMADHSQHSEVDLSRFTSDFYPMKMPDGTERLRKTNPFLETPSPIWSDKKLSLYVTMAPGNAPKGILAKFPGSTGTGINSSFENKLGNSNGNPVNDDIYNLHMLWRFQDGNDTNNISKDMYGNPTDGLLETFNSISPIHCRGVTHGHVTYDSETRTYYYVYSLFRNDQTHIRTDGPPNEIWIATSTDGEKFCNDRLLFTAPGGDTNPDATHVFSPYADIAKGTDGKNRLRIYYAGTYLPPEWNGLRGYFMADGIIGLREFEIHLPPTDIKDCAFYIPPPQKSGS